MPTVDRLRLLRRALGLSVLTVGFGAIAGGLSVGAGLADGSLGVFGTGLGVLADIAGSAVLIWRFRAERRDPEAAAHSEARAARVVAASLAVVAGVLAAGAVRELLAGSHPGASTLALVSAGAAAAVLAPLAVAKRRTARGLGSAALHGDSTLSAIGAATAVLALLGLALYRAVGWGWADRVMALVIAVLAAIESIAVRQRAREPGDSGSAGRPSPEP